MENLWDREEEEDTLEEEEEKKIIQTYPDYPFTNITKTSAWFDELIASGFFPEFGETIRCILGNYSELECIYNPNTGERYILVLIPFNSMEFDYKDQNGFEYVLKPCVPNRELLIAAFLCNSGSSELLYDPTIRGSIASMMTALFMSHENI